MRRRDSIVFRLVLVTTACIALLFAATLGYHYYSARRTLEADLESASSNLASSLVNRVEIYLATVAATTAGIARALENGRYAEQELVALIRSAVEQSPDINGAGVAFEPFAFSPEQRLYAPFFYRERGSVVFNDLGGAYEDVPYLLRDWYQIPLELAAPEWSEPYYREAAGSLLTTTYSAPLYAQEGSERRIRGIVSADISLDRLTEIVSSVRILETGYAALLSRNAVILAHPLKPMIMNETFFSIAEARGDPALRELGRRMIRGETGFLKYESLMGVKSWMYYTPIRSTGWTLAVVFPEQELLADINRLSLRMTLLGGAGIVLLIAAVVAIASSITRPLRRLAAATHELAAGNFDLALPAMRTRDEVGELAHDFAAMKEALKQYIRELTETTAAKERIQSELRLASDIQASLLPRVFPPFPTRSELDIYAAMDPAKEVGGDFYDFFFVDHDRLCFLIADVADKGVPAALYMMVAKTLLKTEAQRLGEPDGILSSVNRILAADNERCMFATVFCAIIDLRTGEIRYANAGHNPPVLVGPQGAHFLDVQAAMMLGPLADARYRTERARLRPGETLFLYTDGVTEAMNPQGQLFGAPALCDALREVARAAPEIMVRHLRAVLMRHADTAPQSDDVTMLALTYRGAADSGQGSAAA